MEMTELEKVIKEWEAVLSRDPLDAPWDLIDDTLALLKEQKAEIEQLNRFVNGFSRDAMPVVRCKDCANGEVRTQSWDGVQYVECHAHEEEGYDHEDGHPLDWFCADGERR